MKKYVELYEKGNDKFESDFDMVNYIQNMRDLKEIKDWYDNFNKNNKL